MSHIKQEVRVFGNRGMTPELPMPASLPWTTPRL